MKREAEDWEWRKNGQGLLVRSPVDRARQADAERAYAEIKRRDDERREEAMRRYEAAKQHEEEQRILVSLRIGVFFDGTGNNASNTEMGLRCGAHHPLTSGDLEGSCRAYMKDSDSSYGNDVTNIAKLYRLYYFSDALEVNGRYANAYRKVYVDGVGTRPGQEDSIFSAGTGRGDTGVLGKVIQAAKYVFEQFKWVRDLDGNVRIERLSFDVFGFSRGGAAARHFANQVMRSRQGILQHVLNSRGLDDRFDPYDSRCLSVNFVGLFDTVASVAGAGNLGNIRSAQTPGIDLYLPPNLFRNVVQLTARDEYRANFALNSVAPGHTEIDLPGAHSDIGGGYLPLTEERVLVSPMQAMTVDVTRDVRSTSIYRDAQRARRKWLTRGWPVEYLEIVTPDPLLLDSDPRERLGPRQKRVYAGLLLKRNVSGELSRVYLRVMKTLAELRHVRFDQISDQDPHASLPKALSALAERFVSGDFSVTNKEEKLLRERYIHCSANWNAPQRLQGDFPRTGVLFYINAPTRDGRRSRHTHLR